jgi:hypothetical protein
MQSAKAQARTFDSMSAGERCGNITIGQESVPDQGLLLPRKAFRAKFPTGYAEGFMMVIRSFILG